MNLISLSETDETSNKIDSEFIIFWTKMKRPDRVEHSVNIPIYASSLRQARITEICVRCEDVRKFKQFSIAAIV